MPFDAGNFDDGRRPAVAPNQAKVLTRAEYDALESRLRRESLRSLAALQLSFLAGLRAHEIANIEWKHVSDASGGIAQVITVTDDIAKGGGRLSRSGRIIPLNKALRSTLQALRAARPKDTAIFYPLTPRAGRKKNSPAAVHKFFERLYQDAGLVGASSHSGRRTFITQAARSAPLVGCSLRDVQNWAGHARLSTTQQYIETAPLVRQHAAIDAVWG